MRGWCRAAVLQRTNTGRISYDKDKWLGRLAQGALTGREEAELVC